MQTGTAEATRTATTLPAALRSRIAPELAARLDALRVDQRETLRRLVGLRLWRGELRLSTLRVRLAVGLLAIEAREVGDADFALNVSRLARDLRLSRTTVYDAIAPLIRPRYIGPAKLLPTSRHRLSPGSPSRWTLRTDLWVQDLGRDRGKREE